MSEPEEFEPDLLTAVRQLLAVRGPMTEAELAQAFGEDEDTFGDDVSGSADDTVSWLADGRWADSLSLLEGRVVTHRLTQVEVSHDILHVEPDLVLVHGVPDAVRRLPSGELVDVVFPGLAEPEQRAVPNHLRAPGGSFILAAGTLAALGAGPGDLVALAIRSGDVEVRRIRPAELGDPALVQQTLAGVLEAEGPSFLEPTLLAVCADAPEAFRHPIPPICELIETAGLAYEGDYLASPGFDLAAHLDETARRSLAQEHDLSEAEAHATMILIQHRHSPRGRTPDDLAAAVPFLAEPAVADAVLRSTLFGPREAADDLIGLVDEVWSPAGRPVRPALQWLRAKAYEWRGEVLRAEEALRAAERLDPEWPLTLLDLARYASDRGDAVRGLALLRRAEPYENPELEGLLEHFLPVAGPVVGRNDPCWCGSGRKFKQCHLHRLAELPLAERARWLWNKGRRYLEDGRWPYRLHPVLAERTAYAGDDYAFEGGADDALVADAVLFEGGAFAEFLELRGDLLPEDERLLGEQWLLVDRSVFEVTAVRRGEGLTVRDVRTGDVHDVQERLGSSGLRSGQLICARVVPAGDTMQIFGGMEPVRLHERDDLLALLDSEPDPDELVAFLTRRFAPPVVTNTERDPLVIHDIVLVPSHPEAFVKAMDGTFTRLEEAESPQWLEERTVDDQTRIGAIFRLEPDGLHISSNSDRRAAAVLQKIRGIDPDIRVLSERRTPMDVAAAMRRLREESEEPAEVIADDPAVLEAMTAHIADYERRWLNMEIPALQGLTPRQAAADPTRREDLIQLLASLPDTDDPTAMSANRLRVALGLLD